MMNKKYSQFHVNFELDLLLAKALVERLRQLKIGHTFAHDEEHASAFVSVARADEAKVAAEIEQLPADEAAWQAAEDSLSQYQTSIGGNGSLWYIFPTEELRQLVIRHRLRLLPDCNYVLTWRDVAGLGLELTHADWVPAGQTSFQ